MQKTCLKCGVEFTAANKNRKYCSLKCAYADRIIHKEKECIVCGKKFKPQKKSAKFCSQQCYNSVHRSTRLDDINCLNCGVSFHPKDRSKKFCSLNCAYEYRTISTEKQCPQCGVMFMQNNPKQIYCGIKCAAQSNIKNGNIICPTCNKEFKARNAGTIYCSKECAYKSFSTDEYKERIKQLAIQKSEERGYVWPCQLHTSYRAISKPNLMYKELLESRGYEVQLEVPLSWYLYDLKIENTLIEINPTPFHNSTRNPLTKPKNKMYHYNKAKCAVDKGYKCIMVWDRTTNDELFNLIDSDFIYEGEPNLHRYNIKTKEHILDEGHDKSDMISKGFSEIYDCGNIRHL